MSEFGEEMSISEARERLQSKLDDGAYCPCCGQWAKRYRRRLTSGIAYALCRAYQFYAVGEPFEWKHLNMKANVHDPGMARHWGLVRRNGSKWEITAAGAMFIQNRYRVPKHAIIYDNVLMELDSSDGTTSVVEALGDRFDYDTLMRGK